MTGLNCLLVVTVALAGLAPIVAASVFRRTAADAGTPLPPTATETLRRVEREVASLKVPGHAGNGGEAPLQAAPSPSACSFLGGLASAQLSPQCCTNIQVVTQRQLAQHSLASRCKKGWKCEADGITPLASFETQSLSALCGEPGCLPAVVATMQNNALTQAGAKEMGSVCSTLASMGGSSANPEQISNILSGASGRQGKGGSRAAASKTPGARNHKNKKKGKSSAPSCFPGDAVVQVQGAGKTPLSKVRAGDKIMVDSSGRIGYEHVLAFLHSIPAQTFPFVSVHHEQGEFRASAAHIVFVTSEADGGSRTSKLVGNLEVGDRIFAVSDQSGELVSKPSLVHGIHHGSTQSGMFAPLTSSGTVVVDGVVASNYASSSEKKHLPHWLAHAFLFPVRLYYYFGFSSTWQHLRGVKEVSKGEANSEELHPYLRFMWQGLHVDALLPSK